METQEKVKIGHYEARKKFRFEASHILSSAYSHNCRDHIHGHGYIVEVIFKTDTLNQDTMVIDFGFVKEHIAKIINKYDHKFICHAEDKRTRYTNIADILMSENPTAEHMAKVFFTDIKEELKHHIKEDIVYKVIVHETESGYASYWEE